MSKNLREYVLTENPSLFAFKEEGICYLANDDSEVGIKKQIISEDLFLSFKKEFSN